MEILLGKVQKLAVEMYKFFKGLSLVIFHERFSVREQIQYNLRSVSYFDIPHRKTVNYGFESFSKNRVMSTKAASQRTHLSGVKLSYRRLKIQKHSVSISLPAFLLWSF